MATDVKLDQVDGSFIVLDARVVKAQTSDFMLDSPGRRKGGGPFRRALVHDQNDGLTINFAGDYPGGITLSNVTQIFPQPAPGLLKPPATLVIHGRISYEVQGIHIDGSPATIPVVLDDELNKLQSQISVLTQRLAALEAKVNK